MAVEYQHFLVVTSEDWLPEPDTVERVDKVLRRWNIINRNPVVIDLSDGINAVVKNATISTVTGPGLAFEYEGIDGSEIEVLAGSSLYNADPSERYIQNTTVIVGSDIRVQWSPDHINFELKEPPRMGNKPAKEHDGDPLGCFFQSHFQVKR